MRKTCGIIWHDFCLSLFPFSPAVKALGRFTASTPEVFVTICERLWYNTIYLTTESD